MLHPIEQIQIDFTYRGINRAASQVSRLAEALHGATPDRRMLSQWDLFNDTLLAGGGAMAALGAKAARMASDLQQARVAFTVFTRSVSEANKHIKEMMEFAAVTPFQYTQVERSSRALQAYGMTAKEVMGYLRTIGDLASATGSELEYVAQAVAQIKVGNVGVGLATLRAYGMPTGTIQQKMLQRFGYEGDIYQAPPNLVLKAFREVSNQKFSGLMEQQMKTLNGVISNLIDNITILGREIGDTLATSITPIVKDITSLIQSFREWDSVTKALIARTLLFGGMASAVTGFFGTLMLGVRSYQALAAAANAAAAAQTNVAASAATASAAVAGSAAANTAAAATGGAAAATRYSGASLGFVPVAQSRGAAWVASQRAGMASHWAASSRVASGMAPILGLMGGASLGASIGSAHGEAETTEARRDVQRLTAERQIASVTGNTARVEELTDKIETLSAEIAKSRTGGGMTGSLIGGLSGMGLVMGLGAINPILGVGAAGLIGLGAAANQGNIVKRKDILDRSITQAMDKTSLSNDPNAPKASDYDTATSEGRAEFAAAMQQYASDRLMEGIESTPVGEEMLLRIHQAVYEQQFGSHTQRGAAGQMPTPAPTGGAKSMKFEVVANNELLWEGELPTKLEDFKNLPPETKREILDAYAEMLRHKISKYPDYTGASGRIISSDNLKTRPPAPIDESEFVEYLMQLDTEGAASIASQEVQRQIAGIEAKRMLMDRQIEMLRAAGHGALGSRGMSIVTELGSPQVDAILRDMLTKYGLDEKDIGQLVQPMSPDILRQMGLSDETLTELGGMPEALGRAGGFGVVRSAPEFAVAAAKASLEKHTREAAELFASFVTMSETDASYYTVKADLYDKLTVILNDEITLRQENNRMLEISLATLRTEILRLRSVEGPAYSRPAGGGHGGAFENYQQRAMDIEQINLQESSVTESYAQHYENMAQDASTEAERQSLLGQAYQMRLLAQQQRYDAKSRMWKLEQERIATSAARGASLGELIGEQQGIVAKTTGSTDQADIEAQAEAIEEWLKMYMFQRYTGDLGFQRQELQQQLLGHGMGATGVFGAAETPGTAMLQYTQALNEAKRAYEKLSDPNARLGEGTEEMLQAQTEYTRSLETLRSAAIALNESWKELDKAAGDLYSAIAATAISTAALAGERAFGMGGFRGEFGRTYEQLSGERIAIAEERNTLSYRRSAAQRVIETEALKAAAAGVDPMRSAGYLAALAEMEGVKQAEKGLEARGIVAGREGFLNVQQLRAGYMEEGSAGAGMIQSMYQSMGINNPLAFYLDPRYRSSQEQIMKNAFAQAADYFAVGMTTEGYRAMQAGYEARKQLNIARSPLAQMGMEIFGGPTGAAEYIRPLMAQIDTARIMGDPNSRRIILEVTFPGGPEAYAPEIYQAAVNLMTNVFMSSPGIRTIGGRS